MLVVKLIYLFAAIVSGVFFILYKDILSLILFGVLVLIPIILFLLLVIMRLSVSFELNSDSSILTKGDRGEFNIRVKNRFVLPVIRIKLYGTYKNSFLNQTDKSELCFNAAPFSDRTYKVELVSEHVGNVDVTFSKVKVFDYFCVFALPIKVNKSFSFSIIPSVADVGVNLSQNMYTLSESNIFSKHKPGDDPSEVFQIRDYVGGDKLNRIHWKLSTKQNSFMVKDYSLPISEAALIVVDLCCNPDDPKELDLVDAVFEAAFSLSHLFIEKGTVHRIAWYNKKAKNSYVVSVESLDELYTTMGLIYNSSGYYETPYMAQLDAQIQQNMSHVIYIAPNIGEKHLELANMSKSPSCIFAMLNVISDEGSDNAVSSDEINILPIKAGEVGSSLYDVVL